MAAVEDPSPAPGVPDYMLSPDAVLQDEATRRYGAAPDYFLTRRIWDEIKLCTRLYSSIREHIELTCILLQKPRDTTMRQEF